MAYKDIERFKLYHQQYRESGKSRDNNRKRLNTGTTEQTFFYNYKEPLKPIEGGYGYYGTLAYNEVRDKVQCHICGKLFRFINNGHLNKLHNLTAREYKEKFELAKSTALIGEGTREKMIKRPQVLDETLKKKRTKEILNIVKKRKKLKLHGGLTKISLEDLNKRGMCPAQLLQRIKDLEIKLGHRPSYNEFIEHYKWRYWQPIRRTFGTWENALKKAGYTTYLDEQREKYSKENLIQYLKDFYKLNKRTPTQSDCKRGILPKHDVYVKNFGNMNNARMLAHVPIIIKVGYGYKELSYEEYSK